MGVTDADLGLIDEALASPSASAESAGRLRGKLPHLSLTRCDASDMMEEPFRLYPSYELHLIDAGDACVKFTADPARATGIVLARRG
jgi:hypothetical protein